EKAEIELKKIALELVVRVGGHKRNIVLPSALASYRPKEAKFERGSLTVIFEQEADRGQAEPQAGLGQGRDGIQQADRGHARDRVGGGMSDDGDDGVDVRARARRVP